MLNSWQEQPFLQPCFIVSQLAIQAVSCCLTNQPTNQMYTHLFVFCICILTWTCSCQPVFWFNFNTKILSLSHFGVHEHTMCVKTFDCWHSIYDVIDRLWFQTTDFFLSFFFEITRISPLSPPSYVGIYTLYTFHRW